MVDAKVVKRWEADYSQLCDGLSWGSNAGACSFPHQYSHQACGIHNHNHDWNILLGSFVRSNVMGMVLVLSFIGTQPTSQSILPRPTTTHSILTR